MGTIGLPQRRVALVSMPGYRDQSREIIGETSLIGTSGSEPQQANQSGAQDPNDWVSAEPIDPAVLAPNDFVLKYNPVVTATRWVQPGGSISLTLRSLAPQTVDANSPGVRAVVDFPAGWSATHLELTAGTGDANGYTSWTATYNAPLSDQDGTLGFCLVDQDWQATCSSANEIERVSGDVATMPFGIDGTGPEVVETFPERFHTVLELLDLGARWTDSSSGVDPASLVVKLDGVVMPTSGGGTLALIDPAEVAVGIHHLEVFAADVLGNPTSDEFIFTLATFTDGPANATLRTATIPVNPSGQLVGPDTITFTAPQVDVGGFSEQLNASTWVGYGGVERPFNFGTVTVLFDNGVTAPTPVTVAVPATQTTHQLAVLAPSAGVLQAEIPASTLTFPDIVVPVPAEYRVGNPNAKLQVASATLGAPTIDGPALPNQLQGEVNVVGSIPVCRERPAAPPGGYVRCQDFATLFEAYVPGVTPPVPVLRPVTIVDASDEARTRPKCVVPGGSAPGCVGVDGTTATDRPIDSASVKLQFGCGDYTNLDTQMAFNICDLAGAVGPSDGFFAASVNAWVFASGDHTFPLWQQNYVQARTDSCSNGRAGQVSAAAYRVAANAASLDAAHSPRIGGAFKRSNLQAGDGVAVRLGFRTQATPASDEAAGPQSGDTPAGYQIDADGGLTFQYLGQNEGFYRVATATTVDGRGVQVAGLTGLQGLSTNSWEAAAAPLAQNAEAGFARRVQLVTGTEFTVPNPVGGFALVADLAFQFVVDFRGCGE